MNPQIGDIMHYQVTGELVGIRNYMFNKAIIEVVIKDGDGNLTTGQLKHAEKFGAEEILKDVAEDGSC